MVPARSALRELLLVPLVLLLAIAVSAQTGTDMPEKVSSPQTTVDLSAETPSKAAIAQTIPSSLPEMSTSGPTLPTNSHSTADPHLEHDTNKVTIVKMLAVPDSKRNVQFNIDSRSTHITILIRNSNGIVPSLRLKPPANVTDLEIDQLVDQPDMMLFECPKLASGVWTVILDGRFPGWSLLIQARSEIDFDVQVGRLSGQGKEGVTTAPHSTFLPIPRRDTGVLKIIPVGPLLCRPQEATLMSPHGDELLTVNVTTDEAGGYFASASLLKSQNQFYVAVKASCLTNHLKVVETMQRMEERMMVLPPDHLSRSSEVTEERNVSPNILGAGSTAKPSAASLNIAPGALCALLGTDAKEKCDTRWYQPCYNSHWRAEVAIRTETVNLPLLTGSVEFKSQGGRMTWTMADHPTKLGHLVAASVSGSCCVSSATVTVTKASRSMSCQVKSGRAPISGRMGNGQVVIMLATCLGIAIIAMGGMVIFLLRKRQQYRKEKELQVAFANNLYEKNMSIDRPSLN